MSSQKYYVETWDAARGEFTPQPGVKKGPYSLFGLRRALRKLKGWYDIKRKHAHSVLVYKRS